MTAIPSYIGSDEYIQEKLVEQGYDAPPSDPDELAQYRKLQNKYRKEYYKSGYSSPQSEFQKGRAEPSAEVALTPEQQQMQELGQQKATVFTSTTYKAPARVVNSNARNTEKANLDSILNPLAGRTLSVYRSATGAQLVYKGDQLINENNDIERPGYAADGSDIFSEFMAARPEERASMLATAKRLGYYGDQSPSPAAVAGTGVDGTDRSAIQSLLNFSTSQGRTWRALVKMVDGGAIAVGNLGGGGGGGQGPSYTYDDAAADFKQSAFSVLGRAPTKDEITQAVQAIRASKTDPSVSGAKQAAMASPGEAAAYKAGSALNRIFQLMGGR